MNPEDKDKKIDDESTRSIDPNRKSEGSQDLKRLDSFRIDSVIDSGAMGTVYRAFDESMKRDVALKVLHPSLEISTTAHTRFVREAWIVGQLEHTNIIKVFSRGEDKNLHYIAMELAEFGSLASHIKEVRSIGQSSDITDTITSEYVRSMLAKFADLADALEHIHSKGFIHRDIKPHNILICGNDKNFKFTDFGIAHADDMTQMTRAGDFIGTVKYMSPELLAAHRGTVDKRSDIYSLGVTLYETLTLSLPYNADSQERFVSEILAGHSIPARRRNHKLSKDLETVLQKATEHDPDRRFQTASEFANDLRALINNLPIKARKVPLLIRLNKITKRKTGMSLFGWVPLVTVLSAISLLTYQQLRQSWQHDEDLRTIHRVLREATERRQSPFEFETRWEDLAPVLLEQIVNKPKGPLASKYFKGCLKWDISPGSDYLTDDPGILAIVSQLRFFDTTDSREKSLAVAKSKISYSIDNSLYNSPSPWLSEFQILIGTEYSSPNRSFIPIIESFPWGEGNEIDPGWHVVEVMSVTQVFVNCQFYEPIEEVRKYFYDPSSKSNSRGIVANLPTGRIAIDSANIDDYTVVSRYGDSLIAIGFPEFRRGLGTKQILLDTLLLDSARPVVLDTQFYIIDVYVRDSLSDPEPRSSYITRMRNWTDTLLRIDAITLERGSVDNWGNRAWMEFAGVISDTVFVPIAAQFTITSTGTGENLLRGLIRIRNRKERAFYKGPVEKVILNCVGSCGQL